MGAAQAKHEIPKTMKRLEITEYNDDLAKVKIQVVEVEVPTPKKGQVLVKVVSAPVNPSDYGGFKAPPPGGATHLIGKEGSGIVVASGGGYSANSLVGKKVGFVLTHGGSYSEYAVSDAMTGTFAIPADVPVEDAASFFVNPYTACGFVDTVKGMGATGFVHTAAASQLGQMLVKLTKKENLTMINIVRRQAQVDILKGLGAEHIIDSSEPHWKEALKEKMKELKINIIFDAIAGDNTGDMMECLPDGGTTFVYGGLSGKACANIHPLDLIYRKKKVEGWLLPSWIRDHGTVKTIQRVRWATNLTMPALVNDGWAASTFDDCVLDDMWPKFLAMWNGEGFTNKKLRIRMPLPEEVKEEVKEDAVEEKKEEEKEEKAEEKVEEATEEGEKKEEETKE